MTQNRGATVLLTGLPAAGKSTTAAALERKLVNTWGRVVTVLDGDDVRMSLSAGLGFSDADRATHLMRIGFVAAEVARHGGISICAAIAPQEAARSAMRALIKPLGEFVLVYVRTPLRVCETRDPKGLYAAARAGQLLDLTGLGGPYDVPNDADVTVDAGEESPEQCAGLICDYLRRVGVLVDPATGGFDDGALAMDGS